MRVVILICFVLGTVFAYQESESNCILFGGRCKTSCGSPDAERYDGLCTNKGEICCNDTPKEFRCKSRWGGECIKDCPDNIRKFGKEARDCPKGTYCCVWV